MPDVELSFQRYVYVPANISITIPKKNGDVTLEFENHPFSNMLIVMDYVNRRMPLIQGSIEMETQYISDIYNNVDTTRMTLEIVERRVTADGTILETKSWLKHTFSIIPARPQSVYITSTDAVSNEYTDVMKKLQAFDIYLVDMDAVNWFNQKFDVSLESATRAELMKTVFIQRNIQDVNIYATPPKINDEIEYPNLKIGTLIGNLREMNRKYGLYRDNPIVFYDLKDIYCISKREPNLEIKNDPDFGNITFVLHDPQDSKIKTPGSCEVEGVETHFINVNSDPVPHDTRHKDTSTKFSTLASVDSSGKVSKQTLDNTATAMRNIYSMNELTVDQEMNETIIGQYLTVAASMSSIRFVKPYKAFTFSVENAKSFENYDLANHIFRCLGYSLQIVREGTDRYVTDVIFTIFNPDRGDIRSSEDEKDQYTDLGNDTLGEETTSNGENTEGG